MDKITYYRKVPTAIWPLSRVPEGFYYIKVWPHYCGYRIEFLNTDFLICSISKDTYEEYFL